MAFASTLATNLTSGSSSLASVSGTIQVAIYGDFSTGGSSAGNLVKGSVCLEVSPSAGVWVPIPETTTNVATTLTLTLATGADIRLTVVNGPVIGVTAKYAAVP